MDIGNWNRRQFIQSSTAAFVAGVLADRAAAEPPAAGAGVRPLIISSSNGVKALPKGYSMLREGKDPLDAVIAVVNVVEDDPNDHSVGLGGLPNEDGVVELDASVMHGPSHKSGAVAALHNIKNPSCVARLVMRRTDHCLLVGEGALRFAKAHGFKEENLLTDEAREMWLKWKETHSDIDAWLPPAEESDSHSSDAPKGSGGKNAVPFTWGTINCLGVDAHGDISGTTTTSGLSWKIPGRVGDSPIIGAGLYVDNEVGAAGSTGRGEANIQNCSSFFIVEQMRNGASPEDACMAALKQVAKHTEPRLRDKQGRPAYSLTFYALTKDGRFGGAAMLSGAKMAVCDEKGSRLVELPGLYKKDAQK